MHYDKNGFPCNGRLKKICSALSYCCTCKMSIINAVLFVLSPERILFLKMRREICNSFHENGSLDLGAIC